MKLETKTETETETDLLIAVANVTIVTCARARQTTHAPRAHPPTDARRHAPTHPHSRTHQHYLWGQRWRWVSVITERWRRLLQQEGRVVSLCAFGCCVCVRAWGLGEGDRERVRVCVCDWRVGGRVVWVCAVMWVEGRNSKNRITPWMRLFFYVFEWHWLTKLNIIRIPLATELFWTTYLWLLCSCKL